MAGFPSDTWLRDMIVLGEKRFLISSVYMLLRIRARFSDIRGGCKKKYFCVFDRGHDLPIVRRPAFAMMALAASGQASPGGSLCMTVLTFTPFGIEPQHRSGL